jgi:type I restriction enzyme S subunit
MASPETVSKWTARPIREVCRIISGGTPPKSEATAWCGTFPWASGKDLKTPTLRDTIDHITEDAALAHSKIAPTGSVLVLVRGMGLANGLAVSLVERPMAFNQDLKALIPGHDIAGRFLMYGLMWAGEQVLQNVTTAAHGTKRLTQDDIADFPIAIPAMAEQSAISAVLDQVRAALDAEGKAERTAQELKTAAMRELFTRGLRGEAQKESEIGLVPDSWEVRRLDQCADVVSSRMQYSDLGAVPSSSPRDSVTVLGIKVSDMNRPGNEVEIGESSLMVRLDRAIAAHRCVPPGTIVFPKRGAAIATNKKRLVAQWTVFDPNVIGIRARATMDQRFLFHWFQDFDLRTITDPGPTPQLNKKNLDPVLIPHPPELDEQREIVAILDAIDRKIDLHRCKRDLLDELFKSLLHKLMTGEVRVADLDLSALEALAPDPGGVA